LNYLNNIKFFLNDRKMSKEKDDDDDTEELSRCYYCNLLGVLCKCEFQNPCEKCNKEVCECSDEVEEHGTCCFCGEYCNPCAQSCGACIRNL